MNLRPRKANAILPSAKPRIKPLACAPKRAERKEVLATNSRKTNVVLGVKLHTGFENKQFNAHGRLRGRACNQRSCESSMILRPRKGDTIVRTTKPTDCIPDPKTTKPSIKSLPYASGLVVEPTPINSDKRFRVQERETSMQLRSRNLASNSRKVEGKCKVPTTVDKKPVRMRAIAVPLANCSDIINKQDSNSSPDHGKNERCLRPRQVKVEVKARAPKRKPDPLRAPPPKIPRYEIQVYQDGNRFHEGTVAFAGVKGFRPWPCLITAVLGRKYSVFFYGTDETAEVNIENMYLFCPATVRYLGTRGSNKRYLTELFDRAMDAAETAYTRTLDF